MLRFIHTADLHLDRPFQGLMGAPEYILNRIQQSTFVALERIVTTAIKEEVDFVIIAGDVYDGENRSLLAQSKLRGELNRLALAKIPTYICHGNHDHLGGEWARLSWGGDMHFFNDQVEVKVFEKDGLPLACLYGFSYPKRQVEENMTAYYSKIQDAPYHIGILHGFFKGGIEHDAYAPFSINDLLSKEFDYWALGHIHQRMRLHQNPDIWYPGNPQGLSIKETGEKGCSLVEIDKGQTQVHFVPTADVLWQEESISISGVEDLNSLISILQKAKETLRTEGCGVLVRFILKGSGQLHHELQQGNTREELVELLHEKEEDRDSFVWVTEIKSVTIPEWDRVQLKHSNHFIGDLIDLIDQNEEGVTSYLSELFQHRRARRFVDRLTPEVEEEILKEAENLLIEELMFQGETINEN